MYTLTLTKSERQAIDWIGHRYANGHDLYRNLWVHSGILPEHAERNWDDAGEITFRIPEHVAWIISEIIEEDMLACFSHELCEKLMDLQASIV